MTLTFSRREEFVDRDNTPTSRGLYWYDFVLSRRRHL
jgi:hypothetical protein